MKTRPRKKARLSSKNKSSRQLTIRCSPEEADVLDSAYKLYASRCTNPDSKSGYLKYLMLTALNLEEPEDSDSSESLMIEPDKVRAVKELSDELNIMINCLHDEKETMVSLSKVVRHLKALTGYKHLPESELVSSPVEILNPMIS